MILATVIALGLIKNSQRVNKTRGKRARCPRPGDIVPTAANVRQFFLEGFL